VLHPDVVAPGSAPGPIDRLRIAPRRCGAQIEVDGAAGRPVLDGAVLFNGRNDPFGNDRPEPEYPEPEYPEPDCPGLRERAVDGARAGRGGLRRARRPDRVAVRRFESEVNGMGNAKSADA
jgi:hypothetical protein